MDTRVQLLLVQLSIIMQTTRVCILQQYFAYYARTRVVQRPVRTKCTCLARNVQNIDFHPFTPSESSFQGEVIGGSLRRVRNVNEKLCPGSGNSLSNILLKFLRRRQFLAVFSKRGYRLSVATHVHFVLTFLCIHVYQLVCGYNNIIYNIILILLLYHVLRSQYILWINCTQEVCILQLVVRLILILQYKQVVVVCIPSY